MAGENKGFTKKLADHVVSRSPASYSDTEYEHAKLAFLDWLAVTIAAKDEPLVGALYRQAETFGGNPQATIIGRGGKTSVSQAALINGAMSHALDYDDNLPIFLGHPTVTLASAVLAIAEWKGLSGKEVLAAYMTGLQAGAWVTASTGVEHYLKGFHGTSTMGRQASTAAVSSLLGLTADETCYAFGVSGTLANGVKQSFGSMSKPLHAGVAAQGGVEAALLAAEGFISAPDIYEGSLGFMATHWGENKEVALEDVSSVHPVELLEHKVHAACFCTHGAINVAKNFVEEHNLTADNIESMDVYTSQVSVDNAGKTELAIGLDGKFSIAYTVANMIINGESGPEAFTDEAVRDPAVLDLMKRISLRASDEFGAAALKVGINVVTRDGEKLQGANDPSADIPPLEEKRELLEAKFFGLVTPILGEQKAQALKARVDTMDEATSVEELLSLTVADQQIMAAQ